MRFYIRVIPVCTTVVPLEIKYRTWLAVRRRLSQVHTELALDCPQRLERQGQGLGRGGLTFLHLCTPGCDLPSHVGVSDDWLK